MTPSLKGRWLRNLLARLNVVITARLKEIIRLCENLRKRSNPADPENGSLIPGAGTITSQALPQIC